MFGYYLNLAMRSFKRNKVLTALMVLAIALGIGACMTTLTVFKVLSGDPIPHKSEKLYYVQLDPQNMIGFTPGEEPDFQMTRFDSEALLRDKRADRQAMMTGGGLSITPERSDTPPFVSRARYTSADFFPMFDVPFLHGSAWSAKEDEAQARVVVLSREMAERVFGEGNPVGKTIRLDQADFTVVGVLDEWQPTPRFYDMALQQYGEGDEVYVPFSTAVGLEMGRNGSMNCWADAGGDNTGPNAPCTWIQYWVELDSPEKATAYLNYLNNYSDQQRSAGRFERPTNVRLRDVMDLLEYNKVVPNDVVMQLWLGFGFLLVCLLNTVG
ncbi:MAG TPA: ABC transporter permease, partial [Luteimonas sp.]|nr:ABC transporter permease [Luteimonas sp.]